MHSTSPAIFHKRITAAGVLIATGIVFGDIGTSPLYTLNAVFHDRVVTEDVALGSLIGHFLDLVFSNDPQVYHYHIAGR
jgi:KUP system potassium uptake protein